MAHPEQQKKGLPQHVQELKDMVVVYARQETIEPLRAMGRFIGLGMAGAVTLGLGLTLLVLGGLRALQSETGSTFKGRLSWLPYLLALVASGLAAGLFMAARGRGQRRRR